MKLHNYLTIMLLLAMLLFPITGRAYNETYDVKVGETFTVYTTFHANTTSITWTIPYDYVEPVGDVGPKARSVTFRALKTTSGVIIQSVTRVNYSVDYVDDWYVRISDNGEGGGGEEGTTTFTYNTVEGIPMMFTKYDDGSHNCYTGDKENAAIPLSTTGTVTIPSEVNGYVVKSIGVKSFSNCKGISKVIIPNSVESIGDAVFQDCDELVEVEFGNSIRNIGSNTFASCNSLEKLTFPNSVKYIDNDAIVTCMNLKEITLPEGLIKLGGHSLGGWSLERIISYMNNPVALNDDPVPGYAYNSTTLYVPKGCIGKYQSANIWKKFKNIKEIGSSDVSQATCSEVIAGVDGEIYRVSGIVRNITNTTYGNWHLVDETGEIFIYGTLDKEGKTKNFSSLGIKEGDAVTVEGPRKTNNSIIELVDVTVIEIHSSSGVNMVITDKDIDTQVYSLSGQKLKAPQKGINIVGGKKIMK